MREKIREATVGKAFVKLIKEQGVFKGVVILNDVIKAREEGSDADNVWRMLHDHAAKLNPHFVGFDGARARFTHFFPGGFESDKYLQQERNYKLEAQSKLQASAPLEAALKGKDFGEAVLSVIRATNLLFPVEKSRMMDVLRGPRSDDYIRAAAKFASGEIKSGLAEMEQALKPHSIAKWIVATYLPFLWRPDVHMFLKPQVTTEFADRVGHSFTDRYSPKLNASVYESLVDLASSTAKQIADLKPRDNIDIQSFIWVVGDYVESDRLPD